MRAYSFAVLFCLSALLAVAAGCGHRAALPPQSGTPGITDANRTLPVPEVFSTPPYGVGLSVDSGGNAGGPYLYSVCNKQASVAPATPAVDCYGYAPVMNGVRSFGTSESDSANPCAAFSGPGQADHGPCSTNAAMSAALGKLSISLSDSVGPDSNNPPGVTSEGLVAIEAWQDVMHVKSTALAAGTTVAIQATLKIGGTFNVPCGLAANITPEPVYLLNTGGDLGQLRGECVSGKFQKSVVAPNGNSWSGTTWTGRLKATVGKSEPINGSLYAALNLQSCTQAANVSTCSPGTASGSVKPVAMFYIQPVTAGVTLTYASGHSYLPPTPAP